MFLAYLWISVAARWPPGACFLPVSVLVLHFFLHVKRLFVLQVLRVLVVSI